MNKVTWIMRAFLIASSVVVLAACGGGGAGGSGENLAPTAERLQIVSAATTVQQKYSVSDQLQATYIYDDAEDDEEGNSVFSWYCYKPSTGDRVIVGATSNEYVVQTADAGCMIKFSITPVAESGTREGQRQESGYVAINELSGSTPTPTPNPDQLGTPTSVSVSGTQSLQVGTSATLSASVSYTLGASDSNVTWSSSNPGVLSVTSAGQITANSEGTATITASAGSVSGTHSVQVYNSSAVITGVSVSGSTNYSQNQSETLQATVSYSNGTSTTSSATWSSSNTAVATVDNSGRLTAVGVGSAQITATVDGFSGVLNVTVQDAPLVVDRITISGVSSIESGDTAQFTATIHYTNGSSGQGSVTWSTSSSLIASINASGLLTANGEGTVTVTAAQGSVSATSNVTVTDGGDPTVVSLEIGGAANVTSGETITLTATAGYSDGSSQQVNATWATSNSSVASLSASSGSSVTVSGGTTGTASITASFEGVNDSHSVDVTEPSNIVSIEIFPKTLRTNNNELQQAIAVGTDGNGQKVGLTHLVEWTSSDSSVVSVNATGELSIVNTNGAANITASYQGVEGSFTVEEQDFGPTGFYIYFRKPDGWTDANFYVFLTDSETQPVGGWPGTPMTAMPSLGDSWYGIEIQSDYISSDGRVNFLFNDYDHNSGSTLAQSDDLYRDESAGSQWWTNESTASDTPPDGVTVSGTGTVRLKVVGDSFIYADSAPTVNLAETDVAVGSVFTIVSEDAPIESYFDHWEGDASVFVVNPNESTTRIVAVDVETMTIFPNFERSEVDLHEVGRDLYGSKGCATCHGGEGEGAGGFPPLLMPEIGIKYPSVELLAQYITEEMSGRAVGGCSGTSPGDCAYEVSAMILADAWVPPVVAACDINSSDDMVPSDRNLRLLTKSEYINSVQDIFNVSVSTSALDVVPADSASVNFDTASFLMPSSEKIAGYDVVAGQLADQIINSHGFSGLSSCGTNATCAAEELGMKLFRRPLTSQEISRYASLYSSEDGGRSFVHGFLLSPYFLFRSELGTWDNTAGAYRLNNYEVATLLSYTFWGTTPDDTLLQAAGSSNFDVQAQVTRLLNDEKAETAFVKFIEGWLFDSRYNFPAITDANLQDDLREETIRFVTEIVFGNRNFEELLTANYTYMNSNVANFYGESVSGSGWQQVTYSGDNATRSGVIGHASFLATHTSTSRTSPIKRGVYLRRALLCQEFPEPVAANAGEAPDPSMSIEERFRLHTENEGCQSCHQFIDEPGFSFQNFGMDGLFRTEELAYDGETWHDVDGTGSINSLYAVETQLDVGDGEPYSDMRGLGELLADSPNSSACYARQFYRYTNGRSETDEDKCTINVYGQKFRNGQQNLRELMVELTTMPNYTLRK